MFDYETTLASIRYKVRQLIDLNQRLTADNLRLREHGEELQSIIHQQQTEINTLKEQINTLKLRNTLENKSDATEVKLRINRLIRSLDNTIASLK